MNAGPGVVNAIVANSTTITIQGESALHKQEPLGVYFVEPYAEFPNHLTEPPAVVASVEWTENSAKTCVRDLSRHRRPAAG